MRGFLIPTQCALAGLAVVALVVPARSSLESLTELAGPIAASCPDNPALDGPGVLCEGFDSDRNSTPGFQWSRRPIGAHPTDPLRAVGDPNDDVLGFTIHGGDPPLGTDAGHCGSGIQFRGCQDAVSEENDWHLHSPFEGPGTGYDATPGIGAPDGGKARRGVRSMHMGRHTDASSTLGDSIRLRQVSAFVLDSQGDPSIPGLVPGPGSTLEFWHIISVPDGENFGGGFDRGTSFGGGQVQISLQSHDGSFERWVRLPPTFNGFDSLLENLSICSFDPGDDHVVSFDEGFCGGRGLVWADIGDIHGSDPNCLVDTDDNDPRHKDCGDIRDCSGGPGCTETGALGSGVWVRSAFDLSPFAGRVVRLRWIGMMQGGWSFGESRSALEPESGAPYQMYDGDDGWYIDDIALTDLRQAPLPCDEDLDGDGADNCVDCRATDPSARAGPGEVTDLLFLADGQSMTWSAPASPGSTTLRYEVIRSSNPRGDGFSSVCLETGPGTSASDAAVPPLSRFFYYLVRAENICPFVGTGPLGLTSSGIPRQARHCP